jgi:hypothetical protein
MRDKSFEFQVNASFRVSSTSEYNVGILLHLYAGVSSGSSVRLGSVNCYDAMGRTINMFSDLIINIEIPVFSGISNSMSTL